MDKDITKSTFLQYLTPINFEKFNEMIKSIGVDKYTKKLTTPKLIMILIYSQLTQADSLTHLSTIVSNDDDLQKMINLKSISTSQLSRTLRELDPAHINEIFKDLVMKAIAKNGVEHVKNNLQHINVIDASTISMAISQYPWADFRKTKAGVKLNMRIKFHETSNETLPDKVVISSAKEADKTKIDDLVVTSKNALNIFDRGYVDYENFDEYTDNDILFLSRLKSNAKIKFIKTKTKYIDDKKVTDSIVRLGTKNINQMNNNLRLLRIPDDRDPDKIISIITNDFNRTAKEISDLYRNRWEIENFFKWIKQHLHIKKFYGFSENAVKNQIMAALITYLLLHLFRDKTKSKKSLLEIQRLINICIDKPVKLLIQKINKSPSRSSKGRRKINYDEIFEFTLQQVKEGDTKHLYQDSIYDPVIL